MTTYPEYIAQCQRLQREYIVSEEKRYAKAERLWMIYKLAMYAELGLHPLTGSEIADRQRELARMLASVEDTHGDSMAMRRAYEVQFGKEAV